MQAVNLRDLEKQQMTAQEKVGRAATNPSDYQSIGMRPAQVLKIGNETYVVKMGKKGDFPMEDHLMNTGIINELNLKNVHAPASTELDDKFKRALEQKIPKEFGPNGILGGVLQGNAMISPMAPGYTIWEILGVGGHAPYGMKQQLLDFVRTKDGAHALGAMAMIDLVDGMYDRLVGSFNGTNFLFDSKKQELWCVDNAKAIFPDSIDLLATDDSAWKKKVMEWNSAKDDDIRSATDKGKSVPELFHWMIYERNVGQSRKFPSFFDAIGKLSEQQKKETLVGIREAFNETWTALHNLVTEGGLPPNVSARLSQRLAFLDGRSNFLKQLKIAELNLPEITTIPNLSEKTQRKFGNPEEQKKAALAARKVAIAAGSEKFVQALTNFTKDLGLQFPPGKKVWGELDPTVTEGFQQVANAWANASKEVQDEVHRKQVQGAMEAFLQFLNG